VSLTHSGLSRLIQHPWTVWSIPGLANWVEGKATIIVTKTLRIVLIRGLSWHSEFKIGQLTFLFESFDPQTKPVDASVYPILGGYIHELEMVHCVAVRNYCLGQFVWIFIFPKSTLLWKFEPFPEIIVFSR
jgi:hypothetical protein